MGAIVKPGPIDNVFHRLMHNKLEIYYKLEMYKKLEIEKKKYNCSYIQI